MATTDPQEIARIDALCAWRRHPEQAALAPFSGADQRAIRAAIESFGIEPARILAALPDALLHRLPGLFAPPIERQHALDATPRPVPPAGVTCALATLWRSLRARAAAEPMPRRQAEAMLSSALDRTRLDAAAAFDLHESIADAFALGWEPHQLPWRNLLAEAMARGQFVPLVQFIHEQIDHALGRPYEISIWCADPPERQREHDLRRRRMVTAFLDGPSEDPQFFLSTLEAARAARVTIAQLMHEIGGPQAASRGTLRWLDLQGLVTADDSLASSGLPSSLSLESSDQERQRLVFDLPSPMPALEANADDAGGDVSPEDLLDFLSDLERPDHDDRDRPRG